MTQIKRQLNLTEFSDDRKKKLRKTLDQTKKLINCLENLSNEIFYEIFEYLDGCDIFRIFLNLNSRFKYLLINLSTPLKLNLLYEGSHSLLPYYEKLIISNKHRIISLSLNRIVKYNLSHNSIMIDLSFNRLESLTLAINDLQELKSFTNLSSLPCLFALTIYLHSSIDYNDTIYQKIFSLPKLKYAKVSSEASLRSNRLITTPNDKYTFIQRLIVDHNCTIDTLITILSYTPQLLRLTCNKKLIDSQIYNMPILINKPILTHISINECYSKFTDFEIFFRKISSQLKVLRISILNDVEYLNANRWEQLILKYMPQLSIFEFKYTEFINKNFRITSHHRIVHQFTSSFWIERQWFLQYKVGAGGRKGGVLSYLIHPNKYNQKDPFINQSNNSSSIQLTIVHLAILKWTKPFISSIKPVLNLFNITRLVFGNHGIFIRTLLELIGMLSNLDSLVISSFIWSNKKSLSVPKIIGSKIKANKITKLHIGQVTSLEEIQFLIYLCSHIHYLEMDNIDKIDFEKLLQLILIQYIENDFSLHLRNIPLDDETIQKVQNVINNEKLHDHCLFIHTFNNIYLQYKKY